MKKKTLKITIVTLFPEFIEQYAGFGIIARAIKNRILKLQAVNLRKFAFDKRGTVDDRPYGGGLGMVLKPDVVIRAIQKLSAVSSRRASSSQTNSTQSPQSASLSRKNSIQSSRSAGVSVSNSIQSSRKPRSGAEGHPGSKTRVILLTPQGKVFNQAHAKRLSKYDHLIFISGRYEGFDERVRKFVDEELSIGDYVLMGGELPSLVISEAVTRFVPGILGKDESADDESFAGGLLEFPQYTKPEVLEVAGKRLRVPKVLLSGHHGNVEKWRKEESIKRTKKRRPDLIR